MSVHISALAYHPIKSCRAVVADEVVVEDTGFAGDRRWVLIDPSGRFVSQRECPRLAQITATIEPDALVASAPGHAPLRIPMAAECPVIPVTIWRDAVHAFDEGGTAANWFASATVDCGSRFL